MKLPKVHDIRKNIKEKENELPIMEMFLSIEGEGIRVGTPKVFIRVGGCRVGCRNCDTMESWEADYPESFKSIDYIVDKIIDFDKKVNGLKYLTITGGNPCEYPNSVKNLALKIKEALPIHITIESPGVYHDLEVIDLYSVLDYLSLDIKTPFTIGKDNAYKEAKVLRDYIIPRFYHKSQIKLPVFSKKDLEFIMETKLYETIVDYGLPLIFTPGVSPNYTSIAEYQQSVLNVSKLLKWASEIGIKAHHYRIIPQIHKILLLK